MPVEHKVVINTETKSAVSVAGEGRKAGLSRKKSWFHRFLVGTGSQRGRPGKFAFVESFMTRVGFGDWYSEKIIDQETGKVIHHCEEPLSKHQGHGSAKAP